VGCVGSQLQGTFDEQREHRVIAQLGRGRFHLVVQLNQFNDIGGAQSHHDGSD
jgi:hypothetical protein